MNGLVGVLLAAGRSRRMGTVKQLLRWKGGTVVSAAFDVIAPHCGHIIVVLGHRPDEVRQALAPRTFAEVRTDPDAEMIQSIKAGIREAMSLPSCDAVLLHPADLPATAQATVQSIMDWGRRHPRQAIMPEVNGKGGHPALIPSNLFKPILEWSMPGGLREFWRANADSCCRIPVDDPGCTHDLDMPSDYENRD